MQIEFALSFPLVLPPSSPFRSPEAQHVVPPTPKGWLRAELLGRGGRARRTWVITRLRPARLSSKR